MEMNSRIFGFVLLCAILVSVSCLNKNPLSSPENRYQTLTITRGLPYLLFDSNNNAIILFGQDGVSCSGYGDTDGEIDLIKFVKYNSVGEKIISDKQILSSNAIIDLAAFCVEQPNHIVIVWLDPRNNPDFKSGYHPYYADVYYKIIDSQGNIIEEDTKLSNELIEEYIAQQFFNLEGIYNGTMEDIQNEEILYDADFLPFDSWIIIDSNKNEHYFRVIGEHWDDMCRMIYTKFSYGGQVTMIKEKELIKFEKLPDEYWGPTIQKLYITIDNRDYIHSVWQLNDGRNYFSYYYLKLNDLGEMIVYEKIGVKYLYW